MRADFRLVQPRTGLFHQRKEQIGNDFYDIGCQSAQVGLFLDVMNVNVIMRNGELSSKTILAERNVEDALDGEACRE